MLGNIISAGASLLGGLMGKQSADSARDAQMQMNERNIALQKEFAQQGIQWKVADAKAAGIHPIYALGGSTASFTPVSSNFASDTSMPNAIASAGQDIGRAVNATRTQSQRGDAFTRTTNALQLERMGLENEVLRTEIASKTGRLRTQMNPPFPGDAYLIPGQTQSGGVTNEPMKRTAPGAIPSNEPGAITDTGYGATRIGGYVPLPSKDMKERIEDISPHEWSHFWRNNILPIFGGAGWNPPYSAPKGKEWIYDISNGYRLVDNAMEKYRRDMRRFIPGPHAKDRMGSHTTNF